MATGPNKYRDKRKQKGIEIPTASQQAHLFIVRMDLISSFGKDIHSLRRSVSEGLRHLCNLFERLETGQKKIDKFDENRNIFQVQLKDFNFSATVGFGVGFFDKLRIPDKYRPSKIKAMPNHLGLGDVVRYSLPQTDLIIQLGSTSDFVNRWVFENDYLQHSQYLNKKAEKGTKQHDAQDIVSAICEWATVTDTHAGFQRMDGRNLLGFNDGVSNPRPRSGHKFDRVVWTADEDEGPVLRDGTYMVFQKITHDLDQWRELSVPEQEQWVGRNKITGLLLGSPENDDEKFIEALSHDEPKAKEKLRRLLDEQSDPEKPFYDDETFKKKVPAWSHVRKANPRQEKMPEQKRIDRRIIFRRGYLFSETALNNKSTSGILFICFQRDIDNGFEFIKKNWLNNKNFPTPIQRPFTAYELNKRHSQGRFSPRELERIGRFDFSKRAMLGLDDRDTLKNKIKETMDKDTQNSGREGLGGPSELGVTPTGDFMAIIPFGGGYYFIPPIPDESITNIGQQFFQ